MKLGALFLVAALGGCKCGAQTFAPIAPPPAPVGVRIAYGSEKKTWLEEQASAFQQAAPRTKAGRPIRLQLKAMGSGEAVQGILDGTLQPHVFSPASGAYIALLDQRWLSVAGRTRPISPAGEPVVLSPLVIAMWRPMAEALGWPGKQLGWSDLLRVARSAKGWGTFEHSEWGSFKLGHTHPEFSNSGPPVGPRRGVCRGEKDSRFEPRGSRFEENPELSTHGRRDDRALRQVYGFLRRQDGGARSCLPFRGDSLREPGDRIVREAKPIRLSDRFDLSGRGHLLVGSSVRDSRRRVGQRRRARRGRTVFSVSESQARPAARPCSRFSPGGCIDSNHRARRFSARCGSETTSDLAGGAERGGAAAPGRNLEDGQKAHRRGAALRQVREHARQAARTGQAGRQGVLGQPGRPGSGELDVLRPSSPSADRTDGARRGARPTLVANRQRDCRGGHRAL